jgi:hypothetical protein
MDIGGVEKVFQTLIEGNRLQLIKYALKNNKKD